jgi:hypothetical protein
MTTAADLHPGATIRFIPANKKNRQTVTITKVEPIRGGAMIIGTRTVEAGTRYQRDRIVCLIANDDTAIEIL